MICDEHGHHVIKLTKQELEGNRDLHALIERCSTLVSNLPKESENKLFDELCRVNEYIVAIEEIELEKAGKAVKVEQCLRNEFKQSVL